jgi:hypothetical protein
LAADFRAALRSAHDRETAEAIRPALLARLLATGQWTPEQGLAHALRHTDPWRRGAALARVRPFAEVAAEAGLAVARAGDGSLTAYVLAELAPHLPDALAAPALDLARGLAEASDRAAALTPLGARLSDAAVLAEARAATREILVDTLRVEQLTALAQHLPEAAEEALAAARELTDPGRRAEALAGLLPVLPGPPLVAETLAAALATERWHARVTAIAGLVPHLDQGGLAGALAGARGIAEPGWRAQALAALAARLPQTHAEALELARCGVGEHWRADTLVGVAVHLADQGVFAEAIEAVRALADQDLRDRLVERLAPKLPAALLPAAVAVCQHRHDEYDRAVALAGLAAHLPEPAGVLAEALAAARLVPVVAPRVQALCHVADQLPEPERFAVLDEAWGLAVKIHNSETRDGILDEVVLPRMSGTPFEDDDLNPDLVRETLRDGSRSDLLLRAGSIGAVAVALDGPRAAEEMLAAVRSVH